VISGEGGAVVEASVAAMMLERQPSLTIRTKVEPRKASGEGAQARAQVLRGVNFDKDGNTPRSGGQEDMLGSIDSGTPNFFKDTKKHAASLADDAAGGRPFASAYSFDQVDSPAKTGTPHGDDSYFNNNELAELLTIVHGGAQYAEVGDVGPWNSLSTPTLAEVNRLSTGANAFGKPSAGTKRKSGLSTASNAAANDTSRNAAAPGSTHKKQKTPAHEPVLTAEEEAMRKMKSFSTRGSTLRTVEDKELLDSLVNIHDQPLSAAFKKACLDHNARAEQENQRHDAVGGPSTSRAYDVEDDADGVPRSRNWTHEEDTLVKALVTKHGAKKWALIADKLGGKTQKQVYARWRDYLQPGLTTRPWAAYEEDHLIKIQEVIGNQWAVLARLMPGRSPNAIKNKFHATKRKIERKSLDE
jgi:hypothetical protein